MKIVTKPNIDQLVFDPFRGQHPVVVDHGPFTALAQGADWRGKLERLEAALMAGDTIELPVQHYFSRGVYGRHLSIPKGVTLTGRIHKHSQINILLEGEMSVLTENGIIRVKAPFIVESPPGTKRAGFAHEDSVWMTFCGTDTTDTDVLEDELTTRTYEEYEAYCAKQIKQEN